MLLGESRLVGTLKKAAKASPADETLLAAQRSAQTTLRFSGGRIYQNFHEEDLTVWIKVACEGRIGVATTSSLRHEPLLAAIQAAIGIARLSLPVPAHPAGGRQAGGKQAAPSFSTSDTQEPAPKVETYFPATVQRPLTETVDTIRRLWARFHKRRMDLAGSFVAGESELAVVGSRGLLRYQPLTVGALRLVATEGKASGFAAQAFRDIRELKPEAMAQRAQEFCRMNRDPRPITLGRYDVLLEPEAVAELVEWLSYIGFGAKQFDERTSFLTGRMGDPLMHPRMTIYDDGADPRGLAMPFDFEGVPKRRVDLIQQGKAAGVVYDSAYARLHHTRSTGHAPAYDEHEGPLALNLFLTAGDAPRQDLLRRMERGLWVTRFHYVNGLLNTQEGLMTGLTRDGTFLVKRGKVAGAVKNLRFTQSILKAFSNILAVSREQERVADPAQGFSAVVAPALLIKNFTFTGQTK